MSNYFDHLFSYRHVLSFFPIFCQVLYDRLNRLACQLLGIGDSRYRLDAFGNCLLTATIRKISRLMELRLPDFPRKSTGYFCPSVRSICLYTAQCHTGVKVGRHYRRYGVPADAFSVPTDSAAAVVKFTISILRESCTNAKAKYSSSVVPPDPSVHFYHWLLSYVNRNIIFCISTQD